MILSAWNSLLAHQALKCELEICLLLLCNVIVHKDHGSSVMSNVDPNAMMGVVESPELDPVAQEDRARPRHILKALENQSRRADACRPTHSAQSHKGSHA